MKRIMTRSGKIFGVGLQRTGTGSLHEILQALGIPTRHNPQELFRRIDHPILDKYRAFCDNPVPLLYKRLDSLCPGSKFILTERDEEAWLKSVEWLFTTGRENLDWDHKPVVDRIHQALYGRTTFDRDVFLATYRRHREDVLGYFAARPDDLLVLDLAKETTWVRICEFLGTEVPDRPLPHVHRKAGSGDAKPVRTRIRLAMQRMGLGFVFRLRQRLRRSKMYESSG
jgi:hypothetical protein